MLEIPQLCACGTDHPFKVIQAALISSELVSVEKCSFLPYLVVLKTLFHGLDWWKNDIHQLIHMHISIYSPRYLMLLLPTFKYGHLLEAENMQVSCQHLHHVIAVGK